MSNERFVQLKQNVVEHTNTEKSFDGFAQVKQDQKNVYYSLGFENNSKTSLPLENGNISVFNTPSSKKEESITDRSVTKFDYEKTSVDIFYDVIEPPKTDSSTGSQPLAKKRHFNEAANEDFSTGLDLTNLTYVGEVFGTYIL